MPNEPSLPERAMLRWLTDCGGITYLTAEGHLNKAGRVTSSGDALIGELAKKGLYPISR